MTENRNASEGPKSHADSTEKKLHTPQRASHRPNPRHKPNEKGAREQEQREEELKEAEE